MDKEEGDDDNDDHRLGKAKIASDGRININIDVPSSHTTSLISRLYNSSSHRSVPEVTEPYIPPTLSRLPGSTPPPSLNVVIQIVGSRGDVQPFIALAIILRESYGHRVRIATHPVFKEFVEENGLEFFSIGGDPAELMAFMVKNPGLMPDFESLRSGDVGKRRKNIEEMIKGCWRSCFEAGDGSGVPATDRTVSDWLKNEASPDSISEATLAAFNGEPFVADCIIANPPSFAHIHLAERLGIPLHIMFTMPWSPTKAFPHPLANIESSSTDVSMTNYLTYAMVEMLTWQGLGDIINRFRVQELLLEPMSLFWAPGVLNRLRVPHTYCWSPALIPKPLDWRPEIHVSGFYFLSLASNYTPDQELVDFLSAGPPPIYVGFGSIVVDDPNTMTRMIFDAIKMTGQRALVSKGWGGLGVDAIGILEGVFMLGNVPHDWLFPRVSCVVHHGGAGTTATGILCGKPTVVVPFFGDQQFWGSMVAKADAGPQPVPYAKLTAQKLADSITYALKPESLAKAQKLADKVRKESGNERGAQFFHQELPLDRMRCCIFPDRPAVWRIKRTKILLSAKAAYILVEKNEVEWDDMKLYRAMEYDADTGPPDPISGGISAILGTASSIALGVADMPIETLKLLRITGEKPKTDTGSSKSPQFGSFHNRPSSVLKDTSTMHTDDISSITTRSAESSQTETPIEHEIIITSPNTLTPILSEKESEPGALNSSNVGLGPNSPSGTQPSSPATLPLHSSNQDASSPRSSTERGRGHQKHSSMAEALRIRRESSTSPSGFISRSLSTGSSGHRRSQSDSISEKPRARAKSFSKQTESRSECIVATLDTISGTSKGVGRIIGPSFRSPMDFIVAVHKGFDNLPRAYGEKKDRKVERVTDFSSGMKIGFKESGYNLYDGIFGLAKQPYDGARKEGSLGFFKGLGRGLAGIVLKPLAAGFALPAYVMAGAYKFFQNKLGENVTSYILSARIAQGYAEFPECDEQQLDYCVRSWQEALCEMTTKKGLTQTPGGILNPWQVKNFVNKQKDNRRLKNHSRTFVKSVNKVSNGSQASSPSFANSSQPGRSSAEAASNGQSLAAASSSSSSQERIAPLSQNHSYDITASPTSFASPATLHSNQSKSHSKQALLSSSDVKPRSVQRSPSDQSERSDDIDRELEEVLRLSLKDYESHSALLAEKRKANDSTGSSTTANPATPEEKDEEAAPSQADPDLWMAIKQSLDEMRAMDERHQAERDEVWARHHELVRLGTEEREEAKRIMQAVERGAGKKGTQNNNDTDDHNDNDKHDHKLAVTRAGARQR